MKKIVDLRSDTVTLPTQEMYEAIKIAQSMRPGAEEGGGATTQPEIRIPNSRNPKEAESRNPKHGLVPRRSGFGFRISFGSRISNFGFRTQTLRAFGCRFR